MGRAHFRLQIRVLPAVSEKQTMRLAKLKLADNSIRVAIVEDDGRLRVLDVMQVENVRSLMDLLHAPDPIGLAKSLIDTKDVALAPKLVTVLTSIDRPKETRKSIIHIYLPGGMTHRDAFDLRPTPSKGERLYASVDTRWLSSEFHIPILETITNAQISRAFAGIVQLSSNLPWAFRNHWAKEIRAGRAVAVGSCIDDIIVVWSPLTHPRFDFELVAQSAAHVQMRSALDGPGGGYRKVGPLPRSPPECSPVGFAIMMLFPSTSWTKNMSPQSIQIRFS